MALKDLLTSSLPNYCVTLLSGKSVCFRPMLVCEEKALLLAKQSQDKQSILKNLINVLSNCCSDDDLKKIKEVNITDFENIFLLLRGKSIGESETFQIKCPETQESVQIKVNLETDIKISNNTPTSTIKLNDNLAIVMKPPSVYSLFKYPNYETDSKQLFAFVSSCIKELQTNKEAIKCEEMPEQEVTDFVESLTKKQFAFPLFTGSGYPTNGLTKREYMTTQIMSGLLSNGYSPEDAAERAIRGVDLLLIHLVGIQNTEERIV